MHTQTDHFKTTENNVNYFIVSRSTQYLDGTSQLFNRSTVMNQKCSLRQEFIQRETDSETRSYTTQVWNDALRQVTIVHTSTQA